MSSKRKIESVGVVGGGTMGMGIAALCASSGAKVILLDVSKELSDKSVERMHAGRSPALENPEDASNITTGSIKTDMKLIGACDWICEAVLEDLKVKREVFKQLEAHRKDGSIVTTNTSGIPLRSIYQNMSGRLQKDIAVTHFFNPVKVMRLIELVPGELTTLDVIDALAEFCGKRLGKGVVYAKDTVNFIGNRIGCNWMLAGLHYGAQARTKGLSVEKMDALMSTPMGLPPTGLYGLIDLVGLDVMSLVSKNLDQNLPEKDAGRQYLELPAAERRMLEAGQLGRKTGGGFYRVTKKENGDKLKEVYDPENTSWRLAEEVALNETHQNFVSLLSSEDLEGQFAWGVMSATVCYAADLVPEIADDIVNIDRAMRWGFNWAKGPFEMMDALGADNIIGRLKTENHPIPEMLTKLANAGESNFYKNSGSEYFGVDGEYCPTPSE